VKLPCFLRRTAPRRRSNHLYVAVLTNEAIAFQAYRLLHYHGISPEHLAIVGQGYSSPERVGLLSPVQIAARQARTLGSIGAGLAGIVGTAIAVFWHLDPRLLIVLILATAMMGSLCGMLLGAVFGFLGEGSTASVYRHHLNQGRYLLMIEGSESLVRWGQEVLSHYSTPSPY